MTSSGRSLSDFRGAPDPLVRVAKLGFISFDTTDVDRLVAYYRDALQFALVERSSDRAYLTTGADHHCVEIRHGETRGRTALGFEVSGGLDRAADRLAAAGVVAEHRADPIPGIAASLVIEEPGGAPLHLYERQASSGEKTTSGIRPTKLGHVASHVPDLAEMQIFYEDVLGFRWSDTVGNFFAFLRCGPEHHSINLLAVPAPDGSRNKLFHVAYEMRDITHLRDSLDHISKHGCALEWGVGRHGVGHNLYSYHRDPDGNIVELFTELDLIFDERTGYFEPRPWHEEFPQGPKVWVPSPATQNIWGIKPPW